MQQLKSHRTVKLSLTHSDYDDGHGKLGTLQRNQKTSEKKYFFFLLTNNMYMYAFL